MHLIQFGPRRSKSWPPDCRRLSEIVGDAIVATYNAIGPCVFRQSLRFLRALRFSKCLCTSQRVHRHRTSRLCLRSGQEAIDTELLVLQFDTDVGSMTTTKGTAEHPRSANFTGKPSETTPLMNSVLRTRLPSQARHHQPAALKKESSSFKPLSAPPPPPGTHAHMHVSMRAQALRAALQCSPAEQGLLRQAGAWSNTRAYDDQRRPPTNAAACRHRHFREVDS